jgi:hypothetical protein
MSMGGRVEHGAFDAGEGPVPVVVKRRPAEETIRLLIEQVALRSGEIARLKSILDEAHEHVCSLLCPSVWKSSEPQPHCDLCQRIGKAKA